MTASSRLTCSDVECGGVRIQAALVEAKWLIECLALEPAKIGAIVKDKSMAYIFVHNDCVAQTGKCVLNSNLLHTPVGVAVLCCAETAGALQKEHLFA